MNHQGVWIHVFRGKVWRHTAPESWCRRGGVYSPGLLTGGVFYFEVNERRPRPLYCRCPSLSARTLQMCQFPSLPWTHSDEKSANRTVAFPIKLLNEKVLGFTEHFVSPVTFMTAACPPLNTNLTTHTHTHTRQIAAQLTPVTSLCQNSTCKSWHPGTRGDEIKKRVKGQRLYEVVVKMSLYMSKWAVLSASLSWFTSCQSRLRLCVAYQWRKDGEDGVRDFKRGSEMRNQ